MNIVLIGFMGSGKSTVAQALSSLLGLAHVEMDQLVHQKTQTQTMDELFAKGGELLLRQTEIAIAQEIASQKGAVISTGGGVVLNKIVIDYFKRDGAKVVFLDASLDEIAKRLEKDRSRPLFGDPKLYNFRLPLYRTYADLVVETDRKTPQEIARMIQEKIDGL